MIATVPALIASAGVVASPAVYGQGSDAQQLVVDLAARTGEHWKAAVEYIRENHSPWAPNLDRFEIAPVRLP